MIKKKITFILDDLDKAADKQYVKDVIDSIIDSLYDFPSYVTKVAIDRNKTNTNIMFNLAICRTGDVIFALLIEWASCITQTEDNIRISILIEEDDTKPIRCEIKTQTNTFLA